MHFTLFIIEINKDAGMREILSLHFLCKKALIFDENGFFWYTLT